MTAINYTTGITADGVYVFQKFQEGKKYVFRVSGTFGGGTVTPGFDDGAGNFLPFRDANGDAMTATSGDAWEVRLPDSGKPALTVTGSTTPALVIGITPCVN
jgi:hypothetical protein